MRKLLAVIVVGLVAFGGSLASAHDDPNADGNRKSARRCDTYYREGHAKDANGNNDKRPNGTDNPNFDENTGHSEDHVDPEHDNAKGIVPVAEFEPVRATAFDTLGSAGLLYVHQHTGHYVVRNDYAYVEVVGGGGYSRPDAGQGGYVQGEVDPVAGGPDADFHGNAFATGSGGTGHAEAVCLSVADQKVGDQGEQP